MPRLVCVQVTSPGQKAVTVYITQEMRGRDLSDATAFGELEILLPHKDQVTLSAIPTQRRIQRKLEKFTDNDYLLLSGDPTAIAIAAAVAADVNRGRLKLLKWDRLEERYYPIQVDLRYKPEAE